MDLILVSQDDGSSITATAADRATATSSKCAFQFGACEIADVLEFEAE